MSAYIPKGWPVPAQDRDYALSLAHRIGLAGAATSLGISRVALSSAAAGLPVSSATHAALILARVLDAD